MKQESETQRQLEFVKNKYKELEEAFEGFSIANAEKALEEYFCLLHVASEENQEFAFSALMQQFLEEARLPWPAKVFVYDKYPRGRGNHAGSVALACLNLKESGYTDGEIAKALKMDPRRVPEKLASAPKYWDEIDALSNRFEWLMRTRRDGVFAGISKACPLGRFMSARRGAGVPGLIPAYLEELRGRKPQKQTRRRVTPVKSK